MLDDRACEEGIREIASKPALDYFRNQLLGNILEWTHLATDDRGAAFERLRQQLERS